MPTLTVMNKFAGNFSAILESEPRAKKSQKETRIVALVADPKSVKVHKTDGTGMDIEWKDGHRSAYSFVFLRDACPCALCQEERDKDGRQPGDPLKPVAGALPMFKALARPTEVEPVGKYGIRFTWNDGHQHGIYSWEFLREHCPCQECKSRRLVGTVEAGSRLN